MKYQEIANRIHDVQYHVSQAQMLRIHALYPSLFAALAAGDSGVYTATASKVVDIAEEYLDRANLTDAARGNLDSAIIELRIAIGYAS